MDKASKLRWIFWFENRGREAAEERESLKVRWYWQWDWINWDQRESWRSRVLWFGWRV